VVRAITPAVSGAVEHGGGVAGPALVVVGIWQMSPTAATIAAGIIVWGLDVVRGMQDRRGGERR
jgi:hypothetical protein